MTTQPADHTRPPASMVDTIAGILHEHREVLLRIDIQSYPSRNFKQVSMDHLEPWSGLLTELILTGRLLQSQMEKAMDQVDSKLKGCIKMMTKRSGKDYDSFKKDSVFVLRVMAAHLVLKKQAFFAAQKAGRTPKSHPPWALEAYKKMDDEGDQIDDHIGVEQPRAKKNKSNGSSTSLDMTSPATTLQEKILGSQARSRCLPKFGE